MRAIIFLFISLILAQVANAERICEDYITDEWQDSRYTVKFISGDNVVIDKITGLMWKQCSEGLSGVDCMLGIATKNKWQQDLALIDTLNANGFAGFNDWRLPNIQELRSIAAKNCYKPAINETIFPNTPVDWFWSSSPVIHNPDYVWMSSSDNGYDGSNVRDSFNRVRLVRQ